jgi:hypothetical protein
MPAKPAQHILAWLLLVHHRVVKDQRSPKEKTLDSVKCKTERGFNSSRICTRQGRVPN